ncbi:Syntaxin-binding protein 3 [Trapelia coarctata]|nr:Syntaxin-binding protein 3 [Trapelia coarctata]
MFCFNTEILFLVVLLFTEAHSQDASNYGNFTKAALPNSSPPSSPSPNTPAVPPQAPIVTYHSAGIGHGPLYTLSEVYDNGLTIGPIRTPQLPGGARPIQTPGGQPSYELTPAAPTPFKPIPVMTTLQKLPAPPPPPPPPPTPSPPQAPAHTPAPPAPNPNNLPAPPPTPPRLPINPITTAIVSPLPAAAPATPTPAPVPPAPVVIVSGTPIIQGSAPVVLGGTTISLPGGTPTIIGGQTIALSSGILHVGTLTAALPTQPLGALTPTTPLVLGGMTFSPAPAITGAPVVIAGATVTFIPSASDIVIGSKTIMLGEVATISGTPVSLGPSGLVIGAATGTGALTTVALPSGTAVSGAGLGGVILIVFSGPVAGPTGTARGSATATVKPFLGAGTRGRGEGKAMLGIGLMIVVGLGFGGFV